MTSTGDRSSYERLLRAVDQLGLQQANRRRDDVMVQCPAHEDHGPSLHLTYRPADGRTLVKCHAGCEAAAVVGAFGLSMPDLFDEPLPARQPRPAAPTKRRTRASTTRKPAEPRPAKKPAPNLGRKVGVAVETPYLYCDADGVVVGRQVRIEQPYEQRTKKRFVQQHLDDTGAWIDGGWSPRGLYLLPEVVQAIAAGDRAIVVCEGEKDVHTAVDRLGMTATTNCGGAPNWTPLCSEQLADAGEVWLVLDRDQAGYLRGLDLPAIAPALPGRVRWLLPADRAGINDLTDHVDAGLGVADLVEVTRLELVRRLLGLGDAGAAAVARWIAGQIESAAADLVAVFGDELTETLQLVVEKAPHSGHVEAVEAHLSGLLSRAPRTAAREPASGSWAIYHRPSYKLHQGALWRLAKAETDKTPEVWSLVLGCEAVVERTEYADTGEAATEPDQAPKTSTYLIRYRTHTQTGVQDLGLQRVAADKFAKGDWLLQSPAVSGGVYIPVTMRERSQAAEAVLSVSRELLHPSPVFTATGWRTDRDGHSFYVHAGAGEGRGKAITAAGEIPIRTHLSGPAAHITLPPPPPTVQDWRDGVDELVYLLDHLPERIGAVMLGTVARATIGWTPTSLVFTGDYEAGKTSLAMLLGSHFDLDLPYDQARLSFAKGGTTFLAGRRICNKVADAIVVLDDANPDEGTTAAARLMGQHARAQFGSVERNGATRGGDDDETLPTTRSNGKPRGTQAMTGELSPADAGLNSAESRMFLLRISLGEIDTRTVLPDLHRPERRARRGAAVAGLIQWMASRVDQLRIDLNAYTGRDAAESYTLHFDALGMAPRVARVLADYAFGWRLWLAAARTAEAIDDDRAEQLWTRAMAGLVQAGKATMAGAGQARYDGQMREYLASALSMGEAHLIAWGRTDLHLELAEACGWKPDPRPVMGHRGADGQPLEQERIIMPSGKRAGWVDVEEGRAYLDPDAVLRVCTTMARAAGGQWETTRRVLGAALKSAGWSRPEVERDGDAIKNRAERRIRRGVAKLAVWDVDLDWLLGLDDDDYSGPGARLVPPTPMLGPAGTDVEDQLDLAAGAETAVLRPVIQTSPVAAVRDLPAAAVAAAVSTSLSPAVPTQAVQPMASRLHVGVHPFEVLEPTFDRLPAEQLDPCITCGHPCSMRFGQILLHPACAAPADLTFDDQGVIHPAQPTAAMTEDPPNAVVDPPSNAAIPETTSSPRPGTPAVTESATVVYGRWRALAAVADVDGLHLSTGERLDLPEPLTHAGHLAAAGIELGLGWGEYDEHWRPERGQIWITTALASRLGLPSSLPSDTDTKAWRALADSPWLAGADAAGWQFGQQQGQPLPRIKPWTTLWRAGGGGLTLAVPSWTASGLHRLGADDQPTAQQLVERIERYAELMGRPFYWSHAISGLRLLQYLHRNPRQTQITTAVTLPPPALDRRAGERELVWHRPPTDLESGQSWVHGFDVTGMYLAAANSLPVGLDVEPEHLTGPVAFDPARPGFWHLAAPVDYPGHGLMPTMTDSSAANRPVTIEADGTCWVTTPTLGLLVRDWRLDVTVTEAYLWPAKAKGARLFDVFYENGRDALYRLPKLGSADDRAIRTAVKSTYTDAIGRLAQILPQGQQPGPWWRPDWQQAIVANAAAKLLRVVARVGEETGRWPMAIVTDAVYYASDAPDRRGAAPAGLPLDPDFDEEHPEKAFLLGKFKWAGRAPMDTVRDLLASPRKLSDFGGLFAKDDR